MIQAGIEGDSSRGQPGALVPWSEVYPYEPHPNSRTLPVSNILINDAIYVQVFYSGQTAYFYINDTSIPGNFHTWPDTFTGHSGGTAEWIIEKNDPPLSHWSINPYMITNAEALKNGAWTCAGVGPHVSMQMFQTPPYDNSHVLAYGGPRTDPGTYCNFPITRSPNY
jgi:hypothetical protein